MVCEGDGRCPAQKHRWRQIRPGRSAACRVLAVPVTTNVLGAHVVWNKLLKTLNTVGQPKAWCLVPHEKGTLPVKRCAKQFETWQLGISDAEGSGWTKASSAVFLVLTLVRLVSSSRKVAFGQAHDMVPRTKLATAEAPLYRPRLLHPVKNIR